MLLFLPRLGPEIRSSKNRRQHSAAQKKEVFFPAIDGTVIHLAAFQPGFAM